jgi:hypothetical protein
MEIGLAKVDATDQEKLMIQMEDEPWQAIAGVKALLLGTPYRSQEKHEKIRKELEQRLREAARGAKPDKSKTWINFLKVKLLLAVAITCTTDLGGRLRQFVHGKQNEMPAW